MGENVDDGVLENALNIFVQFFSDVINYIFSPEKLMFLLFFGRYTLLREARKLTVWLLFVTLPFYIEVGILLHFLDKSLEGNEQSTSQIQSLLVDAFFTMALPFALIVYCRSQSAILVIYQYTQLGFSIYCFFTRWKNNNIDVNRANSYENTDWIKQTSLAFTLLAQLYLMKRVEKPGIERKQ